MPEKTNKIKYFLMLLTATVVWGLAFVAQTAGSESISSLWFNGIRFVLGTMVLIPFAVVFEHKKTERKTKKRGLFASLVCGTFLFLGVFFQQKGIELTKSPGLSGFLSGFYVIIVPVLCLVLFKKKTGINVWIGAFVTIAGMYLLCMKQETTEAVTQGNLLKGEIFLLLAGVSFAFQVLFTDRFGSDLPSFHFCVGQFFTCGVLNCIFGAVFEQLTMENIKGALLPILYCGILSVGLGYTCQIFGQKHTEPAVATIVLSMEAVFSAVFGVALGYDKFSMTSMLGCATMLFGMLLSQLDIGIFKKKGKEKKIELPENNISKE